MKNKEKRTLAIATLGCKVNQYDSAFMVEMLKKEGYKIVEFSTKADLYIVNTCTVTHKTDYQARQLIRRALRKDPESKVLVTGCYAQVSPELIAGIDKRVFVIGNREKRDIVRFVERVFQDGDQFIEVEDIGLETRFCDPPIERFLHQTRAYLKIQDGCNERCAYCIVPIVRGRSRSLPPEPVLERIKRLSSLGYKEIVLTGIHLGAYGLDLCPKTDLFSLLKDIEKLNLKCRIRLSSIEPNEIKESLIEVFCSFEFLCPHLHIPLQSGDNEILEKMRRPYNCRFFETLIDKLISKIPELNIGIDVIVGFPGETQSHFKNTYNFIERLPITYIHVFPFSKRPNTDAEMLSCEVLPDEIKDRCKLLRELAQKKRERFYSQYKGKTLEVLFEEKRDKETGLLRGFSRNYIPVLVDGSDDFMREEIPVRIEKIDTTKVFGKVCSCQTL